MTHHKSITVVLTIVTLSLTPVSAQALLWLLPATAVGAPLIEYSKAKARVERDKKALAKLEAERQRKIDMQNRHNREYAAQHGNAAIRSERSLRIPAQVPGGQTVHGYQYLK
ncbi:MAG: hypothetical protein KZQ89_04390 [Candidatus Thiodiazotropha sp. (ex Lucinoma kastoroae)]|nr:hypothetical protein [Candidatus Thiodiazotropha sp. (ex Lucinoma kastoroae)]